MKVVFPNGRSALYRLPEPVEFNPVGYRVLVPLRDGRGATGVVVRRLLLNHEGLPFIDSFPDRYPVINPLGLEVLKRNLSEYLTTLGEAVFKLIPPWADWYQEIFVVVSKFSPAGLPKSVLKVAEGIKRRGKLELEKAKKLYGLDLLKFLHERGILKIETRWVAPKVEERFLSPAISSVEELLERIKRASKKRKGEALKIFKLLEERGYPLELEEIVAETGVSRETLRYLLQKGVLKEKSYLPEPFKESPLKASLVEALEPPGRGLFENISFDERVRKIAAFAEKVLSEGGDVLLLTPTSEAVELYAERLGALFGDRAVPFSRRMPQKEGIKSWFKAAHHFGKLFITTPQNLFVPLRDLKLLVLDDEAGNYKMERHPYFNLKRLAFELASLKGASAVVFANPPSVEMKLFSRTFEVKREKKNFKGFLYEGENPLSDGNVLNLFGEYSTRPTLVLVPKGGYSNLRCVRCGTVVECERCEVLLRLEETGEAVCPVCGFKAEISECPRCGGELAPFGYGIDRVKGRLKNLFPEGRFSFSTYPAEPLEGRFEAVFVLFADRILSLPDFRKAEELFIYLKKALLLLKEGGFFFLHSRENSHAVSAIFEGDEIFYETEIGYRKALKLPPFSKLYLVALSLKEENENLALKVFKEIKTSLRRLPVEISFSRAPTFKLRERYRFQVLIKVPPKLSHSDMKTLTEVLKGIKKRYKFAKVIPNPRSFL